MSPRWRIPVSIGKMTPGTLGGDKRAQPTPRGFVMARGPGSANAESPPFAGDPGTLGGGGSIVHTPPVPPRYWVVNPVYSGLSPTPGTAYTFTVVQRRTDSVTPGQPTLTDDDDATTPIHAAGATWSQGTNRGRIDTFLLASGGQWTIDTLNNDTKTVQTQSAICDAASYGIVVAADSGSGSGTTLNHSRTIASPFAPCQFSIATFNAASGATMTLDANNADEVQFTPDTGATQEFSYATRALWVEADSPFSTVIDADWTNLTGDWAWTFIELASVP